MNIFSKKLLMGGKKEYTLTVVTDPASATCTLTYDGVSHNSKTATVKAGTVISYSVYQATYGTTTGTITMDSDKTLTCTGTYSTNTTDVSWSNPTMTSSSHSSGFSAFADSTYSSREPWHIFDGASGTGNLWESNNQFPHYIGFYNPTPIRIESISFYFLSSGGHYYSPTSYRLEYSQDGSNYYSLTSETQSSNPGNISFTRPVAGYFKYYRLYMTAGGYRGYVAINECYVSGYYKTTSYTYYWNKSIT